MLISFVVLVVAVLFAVVALVSSWRGHLEPATMTGEAQERWFLARLRRHPRIRRFIRERLDRERFAGLTLTLAFAAAVAAAVAVGSLADLFGRNARVEHADAWIAAWGVGRADTLAVQTLQWWTHLGTAPVLIPAIAAMTILAWATRGRRPALEQLVFLLSASTGASLLSTLVKHLVNRSRPDIIHLTTYGGPSFPSGHSCSAAAGWAALALAIGVGRSRRFRIAAMTTGVFLAMGVASSRALLGVHWLTDVIAGLALGWGWFMVCAVVWGGRRLRAGDVAARLGAPSAIAEPANEGAGDVSPDAPSPHPTGARTR